MGNTKIEVSNDRNLNSNEIYGLNAAIVPRKNNTAIVPRKNNKSSNCTEKG